MQKVILLIQLLIGVTVQGQELVGKPCVIDPDMRGTCFYDARGEISYWLVRVWRPAALGGGPETALNEFVGYPGVLKAQQDYNRRIKEDKESGFYLEGKRNSSPPQTPVETIAEQAQRLRDGIGADGRFVPDTRSYGIDIAPPHRGWDMSLNRIYAPDHIMERGDLNPDTIRIPFFLSGAELLAAERRMLLDCRAASRSLIRLNEALKVGDETWEYWVNRSLLEGYGICSSGLSKKEKFTGLQRALQARKDQLDAARVISRRIDDTVRKLGADYDFRPIKIEDFPEGFADRLALMQASMDDALRAAAAMEPICAERQREIDEPFERAQRARIAKAEAERQRLEDEYKKELDARFGNARN